MPPREVSTGGRPRSAHVDGAILDAALKLFVEGGLAAVSFEQIAITAGVSRAAIYRRWKTSDDIVAAALGQLRQQAEAPLSDWSSRPLGEVIEWFIETVPRQMCNPFYRKLSRNVLALDESSAIRAIYLRDVLRPRRDAFTAMINRARREGELGEGSDPDLLQDMLSGALLYQMLFQSAEQTEGEIRDYLLQLLRALALLPHEAQDSSFS